MARSFNVSNPDYIYRAAPVTGAPFTLSVWYNSISVTANRAIACLVDTASNNNNFMLYHGSNTWPYFYIENSAGWNQTADPSGRAINNWWHACAIEVASNDHRLYNHGELRTSSTSRVPSSIDRYAIGIRADLTPDFGHNGYVAEAALWDVALTEAEALALKAGYSPLLIRPQSLVSYLPAIRDNDADLIDGVIWTVSGSPGIAAHPRVFYPASIF